MTKITLTDNDIINKAIPLETLYKSLLLFTSPKTSQTQIKSFQLFFKFSNKPKTKARNGATSRRIKLSIAGGGYIHRRVEFRSRRHPRCSPLRLDLRSRPNRRFSMRMAPSSRCRKQNRRRISNRFRSISSTAGSSCEQRTEEESPPISPEAYFLTGITVVGEIRRVRDLFIGILRRRWAPGITAVWSRIPRVLHWHVARVSLVLSLVPSDLGS